MMTPARSWAVVSLSLALMILAACSTTRRDDTPEGAQARLLERQNGKGWTQVTAEPGELDPITRALLTSRARLAPFLSNPAEASTPSVEAEEPAEPTEPTGPPAETVSLRLRAMPLDEALDLLTEPLGMNLAIPGGLEQPVTVNFPEITLREAVDVILQRENLQLVAAGAVWDVRPRDARPPLETRTFRLQSGATVDPKQLESFITTGRGSYTIDAQGKTLVVTDEPEVFPRVDAYLNLMDRREPQVLIEALIMEVKHTDQDLLGTKMAVDHVRIGDIVSGFASSQVPVFGPPGVPAPFKFDLLSPNNGFSFSFLGNRKLTNLNVLSNPLLSTVSGKEAKLEVIERVPYVRSENTVTSGSGGLDQSFQEVDFKDVGVKLKVTPVVGGDGIIEMQVEPEVLELVDFVLNTPVIDERRVTTTVQVRNNETLMIGGLLRDAHRRVENRVPLLGDIPILGNLFKSVDDTIEKVELLIFITPHTVSAGRDFIEGFQPQDHFIERENRFPALRKTRGEELEPTDTDEER